MPFDISNCHFELIWKSPQVLPILPSLFQALSHQASSLAECSWVWPRRLLHTPNLSKKGLCCKKQTKKNTKQICVKCNTWSETNVGIFCGHKSFFCAFSSYVSCCVWGKTKHSLAPPSIPLHSVSLNSMQFPASFCLHPWSTQEIHSLSISAVFLPIRALTPDLLKTYTPWLFLQFFLLFPALTPDLLKKYTPCLSLQFPAFFMLEPLIHLRNTLSAFSCSFLSSPALTPDPLKKNKHCLNLMDESESRVKRVLRMERAQKVLLKPV